MFCLFFSLNSLWFFFFFLLVLITFFGHMFLLSSFLLLQDHFPPYLPVTKPTCVSLSGQKSLNRAFLPLNETRASRRKMKRESLPARPFKFTIVYIAYAQSIFLLFTYIVAYNLLHLRLCYFIYCDLGELIDVVKQQSLLRTTDLRRERIV